MGILRIMPQHPKALEASLRSSCLKGPDNNSESIRTREHFTHIFGSRKRHSSTSLSSLPLFHSLWGRGLPKGQGSGQALEHTVRGELEGILTTSTSPWGEIFGISVIFPITDMNIGVR